MISTIQTDVHGTLKFILILDTKIHKEYIYIGDWTRSVQALTHLPQAGMSYTKKEVKLNRRRPR